MTIDLNKRPTRCAQVNAALRHFGRAEVLVRDPHGYFYFHEGDAPTWPRSGVYTYRISDFTIGEWLDQHAELLADATRW